MVRAFHPLMRLSRDLVNWYAVAMADDAWGGHYEFTLPTSALAAGARIEDLGNDGPFTPPERRGRTYVGKTPDGTPDDLTFAFRPVRPRYFHEAPEQFDRPGLRLPPGEAGRPGLDQGVEEPTAAPRGLDAPRRRSRWCRRLARRLRRSRCAAAGSTLSPRSSHHVEERPSSDPAPAAA